MEQKISETQAAIDRAKAEAQDPRAAGGGPAVEQVQIDSRTREELLAGKPDIEPFADDKGAIGTTIDTCETIENALWVQALKKEIEDVYTIVSQAIGTLQQITTRHDDQIKEIRVQVGVLNQVSTDSAAFENKLSRRLDAIDMRLNNHSSGIKKIALCPLCDGSAWDAPEGGQCVLCKGSGNVPFWVIEKLSRRFAK